MYNDHLCHLLDIKLCDPYHDALYRCPLNVSDRVNMGWDGMGWDGMGWDGMGWDGMGWDGMG